MEVKAAAVQHQLNQHTPRDIFKIKAAQLYTGLGRYRTSWLLRALLAGVVMVSVQQAAQAATLEVTTTADQDGEDASNCSLREAVHAALAKEAYGGCEAGTRGYTDTIELEAKTYQLEREIDIIQRIKKFGKPVRISGPENVNFTKRDPITGNLGKRGEPTAVIKAASGKRLFNSARDKIGLTLNNIKLVGGGGLVSRGGAFLVGGQLNLNNVFVSGFNAQQGGVFYVEGISSGLSLNRVRISDNTAERGAVYSGDCADNLSFNKRTIDIANSSIVSNTATSKANQSNIMTFCGAPTVTIDNTTLANNTASHALIDFTKTTAFAEGGSTVTPELNLEQVTIAKNSHGLSYNQRGIINVTNSVLAYNTAFDCAYDGEDVNDQSALAISNTLLTGTATTKDTNHCAWRQRFERNSDGSQGDPIEDKYNTYVTKGSFNSYFEAGLKNYGLGLLGYLPALQTDAALALTGRNACGGSDKRGVIRAETGVSKRVGDVSCLKGALERGRLQAIDDAKTNNVSYTGVVDNLIEQSEVEAPEDASDELVAEYNDYVDRQKATLKAYKAALKNRFRAVAVDVFANDIPHEANGANGGLASDVKLFPLLRGLDASGNYIIEDKDNYAVSAKPLGSTSEIAFDDDGNSIDSVFSKVDTLRCAYDANLGQLIAWRTDGSITPAGQTDYCAYTIRLKSDSSVVSTGYVPVQFVNIAPVAEDLEIETEGDEAEVVIDLTQYINDDGDGLARPEGVPEFYAVTTDVSKDANGDRVITRVPAYVEIVTPPESGYLRFEDDGLPCPNSNEAQSEAAICHTPKFTYVRSNTLSDFDYSFTYRVYDAGTLSPSGIITGSLASNIATVEIDAKRKRSTATPIVSGGGSVGLWFVFGLSGLAALGKLARRRKNDW